MVYVSRVCASKIGRGMEDKSFGGQKILGTVLEYHKTVNELREELLSQSFAVRLAKKSGNLLGSKEKRRREASATRLARISESSTTSAAAGPAARPIFQWPSQESTLGWSMEPGSSRSERSGTSEVVENQQLCQHEDPDEGLAAAIIPVAHGQNESGCIVRDGAHLSVYPPESCLGGVLPSNELDVGVALICGTNLSREKDEEMLEHNSNKGSWHDNQIQNSQSKMKQKGTDHRCPMCGQITAHKTGGEIPEEESTSIELQQQEWPALDSEEVLVKPPALFKQSSGHVENSMRESEIISPELEDNVADMDDLVTEDTCNLLCTLRDKLQDMHAELTTFVAEPKFE